MKRPTERGAVPARREPARRLALGPADMNWRRFWIRTLVAMLLFNGFAVLITWFFIFPHLHPAH